MNAHSFTPPDPTTYFTASASRDPEVVLALLGRVPSSSLVLLRGLTLGIVTGADLGTEGRFDIDVDPAYKFRVLIPETDSRIEVVCYDGLTAQEIELLREHSLEGIATRGVEQQIGSPEPVGVGLIHILRPGISYSILQFDEREEHPNGKESSIRGATETRKRFLERRHGTSPERR